MTAEIRLLRHGETAGYEGDLGLSERGEAQAREAAAALAAEAHGAVRVLYAPSVRARLTAEVLADLARFREIHVSGGDPIAFWLNTPLLGFEPPAVAVRRYWRAIVAHAGETLTVVAAKPSPPTPMRALAAHAFHEDLGEPGNLEAVAVHLDDRRARVDYRGRSTDIAVPELDEPRWR